DQFLENALVLRVVRSPHAHANVKNVDKASALRIPGVKGVLTAEDVPGRNVVVYMLPDQPLITKKARHIGDIVAVVVAENEDAALAGADALKVDYEVLQPVFDTHESLKGKVVIHDEGNIAGVVKIRKGDVDKAFKRCDVVIENSYRAGSQDHAYLETEAAMAIPTGHRTVTVIGTTQNPFRTRACLAEILGLTTAEVTIITPFLGGGFGGKDAYGPIICGLPALAAMKFGKPAVILYTRFESQAYRYKRAPFEIKYKTGATKDGKIQAIEVEYIVEAGAYSTQTLGLMKRAAYHATGVYEVPNVKVDGKAVYTNNIPNSAFNGFGNVQMLFAAESQIELIGEQLKMDPMEIRLKNALVPGSKTGTSQLLDHSVGIKELIEKTAAKADFYDKRAKYAKAPKAAVKKRGIGIGCSWHACGTTGFRKDWAGASVILSHDGSVNYASGIVELGQGTLTSHAMMVAEILGIPLAWIKVEPPDTSKMPDSGETHAQRGTIIGGTAACDAALKLRRTLNKVAAEMLACKEEEIAIEGGKAFNINKPAKKIDFPALAFEVYMKGYSPAEYGFIVAKRGYPDVETGQGEPYAAYTFGCTVAEVEVDTETGQVDVLRLVPGVAAGKIVQPDITRGQVNGCGLMGMGYALIESVLKKDGRVLNPSFTDYLIPTIKDKPELAEYVKVEDEYKYSGFGVKGVGEIALIATPTAIVNAIYNAIGIRFQEIPLNMEKIYFAIKEKSSRGGRS
ncbi:MAG: xanthine dehydrogenase family protein molybdopterin-binding subunit, partial [Chloroflexota bacterium]|nr:xanthine dehydrogenase family protein molybdopterin-binding subunit [Chloroflexota bacterium]